MKKYKPFVSLFFAVLLLLAACNRQISNPTDPSETGATDATDRFTYDNKTWDLATRPIPTLPDQYGDEIDITIQYLPEEVANPEQLPVLKWLCLIPPVGMGTYGQVWSEAAAVEVNQMLADRNMPFRVQFAIYTADYGFPTFDWLGRPEIQEDLKTADLIMANFPVDKVEEYLEPLTQYVTGKTEPSLKNAVPHENNWIQTTKNGEIYGISGLNDYSECAGWRVDPKVFTEFGLTVEDFRKDFWEMDEVLAIIYEKNGNQPFFYLSPDGITSSISVSYGVRMRCSRPLAVGQWMDLCFADATSVYAIDYSQENPTVINMLDSEIGRKFWAALKRYDDAGYLLRDVRQQGESLLEISQLIGSSPYPDWGGKLAIPVTEAINQAPDELMTTTNSVMAASGHKEEAIDLLSLIAEDKEFRTHLLYGKEGRDYTIDTDGVYKRTIQADGSSYKLNSLSPWGQFCDFITTRSAGYGNLEFILEGMTALESYRAVCDDEPLIRHEVLFNPIGLEKELDEVYFRLRYYFSAYSELTEEEYNTMLADISAAGGDKIQAELQKQLDEWVKANPDKVAANRQ